MGGLGVGACLSYIVTPYKAGKERREGWKERDWARKLERRDRVDKGRGGKIMENISARQPYPKRFNPVLLKDPPLALQQMSNNVCPPCLSSLSWGCKA